MVSEGEQRYSKRYVTNGKVQKRGCNALSRLKEEYLGTR